jgi:hypothetical protein
MRLVANTIALCILSVMIDGEGKKTHFISSIHDNLGDTKAH